MAKIVIYECDVCKKRQESIKMPEDWYVVKVMSYTTPDSDPLIKEFLCSDCAHEIFPLPVSKSTDSI